MRRKTAQEIETELQQLQAKLAEQRALERKREQQEAGRRHRLLGIKLERMMERDAALRARMEVEMNGFCTRPYDREVFGFVGPKQAVKGEAPEQTETYFQRLARSTAEPPRAPVSERRSGQRDGVPSSRLHGTGEKSLSRSSVGGSVADACEASDFSNEIDSAIEGVIGGERPKHPLTPADGELGVSRSAVAARGTSAGLPNGGAAPSGASR